MREDRIVIKGLHSSIRLGVKKEEQEVRRNCELDLWIYYDLSAAGRTDDLDLTVNYSKVIDVIQNLATQSQFKLLESFAYCLFREIFHHTKARKARICVKKMNPPIEGRFQYVGVDMTRTREDFETD